MTTTDRFEPFLEPLYIPALFGLMTWVFFRCFGGLNINSQNEVLKQIFFYGLLIFLGLLVVSSVLVAAYELLLFFKKTKSRTVFNGNVQVYRFLRWIFGAVGLFSVAIAVWFLITAVLLWQSGPWTNFHPG